MIEINTLLLAAILTLTIVLVIRGLLQGEKQHQKDVERLNGERWPKVTESDEAWAAKSAQKIIQNVERAHTQGQLTLQDEERTPYRGYTDLEMVEGGPQVAQTAKKEDLEARINRVINTEGFNTTLDYYDILLMEFQATWNKSKSFDDLPLAYQEAILAGEKELSAPKLVELTGPEPFPLPEIVINKPKAAAASINPIDGFPHVVSNVNNSHSGPYNDPKMSIYARQHQQTYARV